MSFEIKSIEKGFSKRINVDEPVSALIAVVVLGDGATLYLSQAEGDTEWHADAVIGNDGEKMFKIDENYDWILENKSIINALDPFKSISENKE